MVKVRLGSGLEWDQGKRQSTPRVSFFPKKCEHLQKNLGLGFGRVIVNPKLSRGL